MAQVSSFAAELIETANAVAAPGKGILAADESTGTIGKRFAGINVANEQDNRRAYRELLFSTPGLNEYISGAITYEETLFDTTIDGSKPLCSLLQEQGILIGIKVDMGVQPLFTQDDETVTQGLTGLADRCRRYYEAGARFAKWRSVLKITPSGCPTQLSIDQNTTVLARYAAICQQNGLVPIVEPEILMDGPHTIEQAAEVTERVLAAQYKALSDHHVMLEGTLLKPNMVRSGTECPTQASMEEVGRATVRVLQHTVPVAVPGVTFLSGGMSEEDATVALNACNNFPAKKPWSLSFSYGRALQQSVLRAWQGSADNVAAAQEQLIIRARANSQAQQGIYGGAAEGASAAGSESLHVKNYSY